jgi:effector-binding domain-containing protein
MMRKDPLNESISDPGRVLCVQFVKANELDDTMIMFRSSRNASLAMGSQNFLMSSFEIQTPETKYALVYRTIVKDNRFDLACKEANQKLQEFIQEHQLKEKLGDAIALSPSDPRVDDPCYYEPGFYISSGQEQIAPLVQGELHVRELKTGTWLVYTHLGAYKGLPNAWKSAMESVYGNGYSMDDELGTCYEHYLNDCDSVGSPDELITKIYIPIKSRSWCLVL